MCLIVSLLFINSRGSKRLYSVLGVTGLRDSQQDPHLRQIKVVSGRNDCNKAEIGVLAAREQMSRMFK